MEHDFVITERVTLGVWELLKIVAGHLGKEIPNSANVHTSRMRDGQVTEVVISWDTPQEVLDVNGKP